MTFLNFVLVLMPRDMTAAESLLYFTKIKEGMFFLVANP